MRFWGILRHFPDGRGVGLAGVAALISVVWLRGLLAKPAEPEAKPEAFAAQNEHVAAAAVAAKSRAIRYGRDIRPILSDHCFKCHGPDIKTRAANLRLDLSESATADRDGVRPIVPGDVEASEVWRRITSDDPQVMMPPPDSSKRPLSEEEQSLIRRWIAEGAVYEPHWAFVPPKRPLVPEVKHANWCRNDIDRFTLARLEEDGASPSSEADRATLIRRMFLDLMGLPPTPQEVDAFVADERPDAYERWVDKLMTQEPYRTRYAERMAVPWLDASRYADTCGIHMDAGRQMWLWRDWVLQAFRTNMPFDRFVTEQIAGDLMPDATNEQKIASGFNRNHVTTDEGGAIAEEYLVEYAVDRTNTTGSVFLGLTVGCGRCHDHKYDPITQKDYYSLYAYFDSIEEPGLYSQVPDPQRALEPFITVPRTDQQAELAELGGAIAGVMAEMETSSSEDDAQLAAFVADISKAMQFTWEPAKVVAVESTGGATLTPQEDGSVLASGANPDKDEQVITLRTQGEGLRVVMLEALADASLPSGRVGRAPNGNAVLTHIEAEAVSTADATKKQTVRFGWAWADIEQTNGDFRALNILDRSDDRGWAVDGHGRPGGRVALLVTDQPFGFAGGTDLRVRLRYNSVYGQHTFGRVRLSVGRAADAGLDRLPLVAGDWYLAGPFPAESPAHAYKTEFGPEQDTSIDPVKRFGNQRWQLKTEFRDALPNALPEGVGATYVGRRIWSPTSRKVEVSLGSDDGFALFVNAKPAASREVSRGVEPDQDKATIELQPGVNALVLKVVNVAGPGGFYFRAVPGKDELTSGFVGAILPQRTQSADLTQRMRQAWRTAHSPVYRARQQKLAELEQRVAVIQAAMPKTMVMKELPTPRETFVLTRGVYDKPDKNRPVSRGVPTALGSLSANAPANRLGLAEWLVAPGNPLVARVTVNRYWEMLFGTGIVQTSEDFGLQGEWPSHPELLDWLAVEFRESGWDTQHMLRLMLTSSTYRQQSRVRPELREVDPGNRLLASFPRRRLAAEFIRDQALYVSGLLVERLGGPSVKPYQPEGLWKEVAMIQSNTRLFQRGNGEELYRRSLYTYWKRACPPPSLMTFDAPTREACTIRRSRTNTPLQALVLWNDEQFVEAARVLATRVMRETADDRARVLDLFRRCAGRAPEAVEMEHILKALEEFRARYRRSPDDAAALVAVGETPLPAGVDKTELATWTMVANALMNLSETMTQR